MNSFWQNKKIVVTGGSGFIGRHLVDALIKEKNVQEKNIIIPLQERYDLLKFENCLEVTRNADLLIHLAAVVGGIEYNRLHPGEVYYKNIMMNTQILEAARINGVGKTLLVSSACAYPLKAPVPLKESYLFEGEPEFTNSPYGFAKLMMLVFSFLTHTICVHEPRAPP